MRIITVAERKALERLRVQGAQLRPDGSYWAVIGGEASHRFQAKVVRRLEERGYIRYSEGGYQLTEVARTLLEVE